MLKDHSSAHEVFGIIVYAVNYYENERTLAENGCFYKFSPLMF